MPRGVTSNTAHSSTPSVCGDGARDAVHHRLEVLLLERDAAELGDRGLLARLARDRLLRRALRGDVLHVRVEPAVAAPARHEDRVDRRPHDLPSGRT